jgi:hypothetical protein
MADESASLHRRYGRLPYQILLRQPWGMERWSRGSGGNSSPEWEGFRGGAADTEEGSRVLELNSPPRPG